MMIFKNIRNFILNHTLVFIVFILLLVFSICSALYSVNLLNNVKKNNTQTSKEERTYVMSVKNFELEGKLNRIVLDDKDVENIYCIIYNNGEIVIADFYGHSHNSGGVSFGKWFSEEDLTEGAKKVILPNYPHFSAEELSQHNELNIGDLFDIDGVTYQAIGIGVLTEFVYQIPYNSIQDKSIISQVAVVTKNLGNKEQVRAFSAYLESVLGGTVVNEPFGQDTTFFDGQNFFDTLLVIGVTSMSVFNLVYIYLYILEMRKKEIAINRISGQTLLSGVMTAYGEIFILTTAVYLFCVLLVELLLFPLFAGLGYWFADSLGFYQYFFVYTVVFVINSIVFLPALIRHITKSPVQALTDE